MSQEELLEYIKEEMDFACELWQDLAEDRKTEEFRNYILIQITNTIFGRKANPEIINDAKVYFESLNFSVRDLD